MNKLLCVTQGLRVKYKLAMPNSLPIITTYAKRKEGVQMEKDKVTQVYDNINFILWYESQLMNICLEG